MLRTLTATCLAMGALALAPAAAFGAAQWLSPFTVSDPGEQNSAPAVAFDGQGEVLAVWQRAQCHISGGPPEMCTNARLLASIRPPGGPFGPAQVFTGDPGTLNSLAPDVRVASDAQGGAVAYWTSQDGGLNKLRYSLRAPGQAFGPAQTVSGDPPGNFVVNPRVAVDPAGNMIAVWISATSSSAGEARFAVGTTATGFGPSQAFPGDATTNDVFHPTQVAFDGQGGIIAIWTTRVSNLGRLRVAIGSLRGFGEPQTIDDDMNQFDSNPVLATDGQGNAVVVFSRQEISVVDRVAYALRAPGQPFGPRKLFDGNTGTSEGPEVAMAPGGRAIAAWFNQDTTRSIRFAIREPGQDFGPAQEMPDSGDTPSEEQVAFDGQGNAINTWTSFDSGVSKVRMARAPAGGSFEPPVTLPGPDSGAEDVQLAFDPQGNAVALWQGTVPFSSPNIDLPLLAAGYDAAGPLLRNLSLPSNGDTRHALTFSVSPVDVWSPLGSTTVSFGDGQSATAQGGAVKLQHTYKSAGTHQVTLTATDALGNSSTASAPVKVLDRTPPVISRLTMTRRTFAVSPKATPRSAARRRMRGSAFRFRLSERAKVTITIARPHPGRRAGTRCVRPTPRLRKRRACTRYVTVAKLTRRHGRAGRNLVSFSGRVGKRALRPGRYRATLRATDAAGNRSKARQVTFRVVA